MAQATSESLSSELEMFDIACADDSVLDKMLEQCICNRIQADEMVLEWVAYSTTKNGLKLSVDTLEQFQNEVLNKRSKTKQSFRRDESHNRTRDIHSLRDLIKAEEEEENLLDSYSTPSKGSQKRALTTPEHPQSKRSSALLASPGHLLSPSSFSPSATPSQKYSQRGGKGEVVSTYGMAQGTRWASRKAMDSDVNVELLEKPEESLRSAYKYMFQRLRDVRNVLAEKIEELGETLQTHFDIEDYSPVSLPAQDSITALGQVCCDSNGKLNAHSVLLEAGPEQGGQQVPVDISELREYSLFPGQASVQQVIWPPRVTEHAKDIGRRISQCLTENSDMQHSTCATPYFSTKVVVMEGMNTTGRKLVASKLYEGIPLPFYTPEVKIEMEADPVSLLVACGPYTPSDSLTFDPLLDLIGVIVRDCPDVCILLGPFVDSKHEQIENSQVTETFEDIFSRCIGSIVEGTKGTGCRLVFVPSQRDVHHHFIYPQPPFTLPDLSKDQAKRVTLVPDPCTLLIDGVTIGVTSTDILFHMSAEEISYGTGSDRFSRILKHMLTQRSYYPLYPPAEENMDFEKFQSFGQMPVTPDVLLVPSELRYFIKDVIGCVCVNPGRLTKGHVGGTFGRLLIQRSAPEDGKRVSPCLAGQVVKI